MSKDDKIINNPDEHADAQKIQRWSVWTQGPKDAKETKRKFKISTPGQERDYKKLVTKRRFQRFEHVESVQPKKEEIANSVGGGGVDMAPNAGPPSKTTKVFLKRRRKVNIKVDGRTKAYKETVKRIKERSVRKQQKEIEQRFSQFAAAANPFREETDMSKKYLETKKGSIEAAAVQSVETIVSPNADKETLTLPEKKYLKTKEDSVEWAVMKSLTEDTTVKQRVSGHREKGDAHDEKGERRAGETKKDWNQRLSGHRSWKAKGSLDTVDKDELKGKWKDRDDKDIDNDGDADQSDRYLHRRRQAIASKHKRESVEVDEKKLSYKERQNLSKGDFALPGKGGGPEGKQGGSYPIPDESHARNALARVSQHGTESEKAKVRAAVKKKFPDIKIGEETEMKKFGEYDLQEKEVDVKDTRRVVDAIRAYYRSKDASRDATSDTMKGKKAKGDKEKAYAKKERGEIKKDDPNWVNRKYHTGIHGEAHEIGTDEYANYTKDMTPGQEPQAQKGVEKEAKKNDLIQKAAKHIQQHQSTRIDDQFKKEEVETEAFANPPKGMKFPTKGVKNMGGPKPRQLKDPKKEKMVGTKSGTKVVDKDDPRYKNHPEHEAVDHSPDQSGGKSVQTPDTVMGVKVQKIKPGLKGMSKAGKMMHKMRMKKQNLRDRDNEAQATRSKKRPTSA